MWRKMYKLVLSISACIWETWVLRGTWDDDIPEASSSRSDIWSNWKVSSAHCFSNYNLRKSLCCNFSFGKKNCIQINLVSYSILLHDIWSSNKLLILRFSSTFWGGGWRVGGGWGWNKHQIILICILCRVLCILIINVYCEDRFTDGQMSW